MKRIECKYVILNEPGVKRMGKGRIQKTYLLILDSSTSSQNDGKIHKILSYRSEGRAIHMIFFAIVYAVRYLEGQLSFTLINNTKW